VTSSLQHSQQPTTNQEINEKINQSINKSINQLISCQDVITGMVRGLLDHLQRHCSQRQIGRISNECFNWGQVTSGRLAADYAVLLDQNDIKLCY